MIKSIQLSIFALTLATNLAYADCDLTPFHWDCEITIHTKAKPSAHSRVDCHGTDVYVNPVQYDIIRRYQRANVNMSLTVNGGRVEGPCIPSER